MCFGIFVVVHLMNVLCVTVCIRYTYAMFRWLEYSRCGEVIDETGILASKTPLKKGFHKCKERPEGIPPSEE